MIPPLSINLLRMPLEDIMIDRRTIFEIHRMANEGSSVRKIAKNLQLNRKTVKKYLKDPNPKKPVISVSVFLKKGKKNSIILNIKTNDCLKLITVYLL